MVENKADEAIEISKQNRDEIGSAYQEVKNVRFSENLACLVFLLPPF